MVGDLETEFGEDGEQQLSRNKFPNVLFQKKIPFNAEKF